MNYKDYSTLKTANKVVLKKKPVNQGGNTYIEQKLYKPDTGAEFIQEIETSVSKLEADKGDKAEKITNLQAEITEIDKMITDARAL